MKHFNILLLLIFLATGVSATAQSSSKRIIQQLKKTENYEGFSVPGWAIRLAVKLMSVEDNEAESDRWKSIFKGIKHVNIATTSLDLQKYNTRAIINNFAKSIHESEGLEEYLSVRSEDKDLKILIDEKHDTAKQLIIMSAEGSEVAFLHFKTNLKLEDLKSISFNQLSKQTFNNSL